MSFSGKPAMLVDKRIQSYGFWPDSAVAEFHKGRTLADDILGGNADASFERG
ncbi:hypothetical protein [Pseudomonas cannabina]|uniref:Uncharacterized protein n=1 Tax=Pseudomonas cannabina pv. alisalensis TaxID=757414 RepID=A0ABS1XIZ4_PSEC1|nr:hypothetical protein [Pseudomonas cannabina]MBM0141451.1 hypothetical protein [Pseudomonas cannabina pv. alisalensis]